MLAPLPLLHRIVLVVVTLVIGVVVGVWVAHSTSVSLAPPGGAVAGGLLAALAAYAVVHDFTHRPLPAHRRH